MTWKLKTALAISAILATAASAAACPKVSVVKNTGHWVISDPSGAQVEAEISNPTIECQVDGDTAKAKVTFTMTGNKSGGTAPVFVAVANVMKGDAVFTSKEVVSKTLENGSTQIVFEDVTIPLGARGLTSDYQVLVGFQLSDEQLSAARKRNSWFSSLF